MSPGEKMKLAKMSLVAALVLGANVYAIDNVKVSGSVQVLYGTDADSVTGEPDIFDKDASYFDTAFHLGITADLAEGVSAGIAATAVSSLGTENNIASVENVWSGAHNVVYDADGNVETIEDALFIDEAWISGTAGKTTGTIGRMPLDTPFAFTEAWGASTNNFEAAVVTNEDLPGTTLMAAWIGKSNGSGDDTTANAGGSMTGTDGKFNTFAESGSYVVGAINNSFEPLTAKAYYYGMPQFADAYWLQADLDMEGIMVGAQYGGVDPKAAGDKDSSAYAAMLGYALKDVVTVTAAYSSVDDEGANPISNVATRNQGAGSQTQLYTEVWWWYGTVGAVGADTFTVAAETTVGDGYDLYLGYWNSDNDVDNFELNEVAFTVSKSYGALDTSVALIYDDFGGATSEDLTTLQVYLTYNF
jgi:hypothetical protein